MPQGSDQVVERQPNTEESPAKQLSWSLAAGVASVTAGLVLLSASPPGALWGIVLLVYLAGVVLLARERDWLIERTQAAIVIVALCAVAATTGMLVATRQHLLWHTLLAALSGAVVAGFGLLMVSDLIQHRLVGTSRRSGIVSGAVLLVGLGFSGWGMLSASRPLAAEGLLAFTLGIVLVNIWLGDIGFRSPLLMLTVGLAGLAQSIVFFLSGRGFDSRMLLGLVCWIAGLTVFKLALGPAIGADQLLAKRVTYGSLAATVVGVVLVIVGGQESNLLGVIGGGTLATLGLSAIGIAVVRVDVRTRVVRVFLVGGAVLIGGGVLLAEQALRVWGITLVVSFAVAAAGAWFVLRGEGLVIVVLLGFVALWGLADRTTAVALDPNPTAAARILALGDSYISGEGAPEYFALTNNVGSGRNECRRAPTAYPHIVAAELEMGLDFFACSGAKTIDVLSRGQMEESSPNVAGAQAQLANIESMPRAQRDAIDAVLISIGGNDVGFSTIVKACLLPRNCNERQEEWFANVALLRPQLVTTYTAIRQKVPNTPIYVIAYPKAVGTKACGLGLQQEEHEFVDEFITRLDSQIEQAAAEAGVRYFASSVTAFADHDLCSDDPATNHLHLSPPAGDWLGRYSPGRWVHGSMHPSPTGHALIADLLTEQVRSDLAAIADGSQLPNPEPIVAEADPADVVAEQAPPTPLEQSQADEAKQLLTDSQWIEDELFRTVQQALLPLTALLAGGVLLAAGLVLSKHDWMRVLTPIHGGGGGRGDASAEPIGEASA